MARDRRHFNLNNSLPVVTIDSSAPKALKKIHLLEIGRR